MRIALLLTLLAATAGLSACQTMTPEERRAVDQRNCAGYGFRPNTDAMARCLLDLELDRRAQTRSMMDRNDSMFWRTPVIVERRVVVRRP